MLLHFKTKLFERKNIHHSLLIKIKNEEKWQKKFVGQVTENKKFRQKNFNLSRLVMRENILENNDGLLI